jgi:hypothetical protein
MNNLPLVPRYLLLQAGLFLLVLGLQAQDDPARWFETPGVLVRAQATGRTTGHIADLFFFNTDDEPVIMEIPPLVVPSAGGYQGYVVAEPVTITIPPEAAVELPLRGYCTDHDLPAAPEGHDLPPLEIWQTDTSLPGLLVTIRESLEDLPEGVAITPMVNHRRHVEPEKLLQQLTWIVNDPSGTYDPCTVMRRSLQLAFGHREDYPDMRMAAEQGIGSVVEVIYQVGMRVGLPGFGEAISDLCPVYAAHELAPEHRGIIVDATSTGRASNHIANLFCWNPTADTLVVRLGKGGPLYIRTNGWNQAYLVPEPPLFTLVPGQRDCVPLFGYCVDIHLPPVSARYGMTPMDYWITMPWEPVLPADLLPGQRLLEIPLRTASHLDTVARVLSRLYPPPVMAGWDCPEGNGRDVSLIPGTDIPVRFTLSPYDEAGFLAPLLMVALDRIIAATDRLYARDDIHTAFHNEREKERETVIQQTLWIYAARLTDVTYTREHYRSLNRSLFLQGTQSYDSLSQDQWEQLDRDVDDFWNTFQAVGVEAKVLPQPAPQPQRLTPPDLFDRPDWGKPITASR